MPVTAGDAPALVFVTDPRASDERIVAVAEAVCRAVPGACVQLRDRARSDDEVRPLATRLRDLAARHGARLVVNRRVALARALGVTGAHVPLDSVHSARDTLGAGAWLSVPAHTDDEVDAARAAGADAVLVSPIFASPGKGPARGTDALREARRRAPDMVLIALGGVDETTARACLDAGADAVAVIRAILDAAEPARAAAALAAR